MLSKIWAKKALDCTFSCQKGAFKQGHSVVRLGLLVFFLGGEVYPFFHGGCVTVNRSADCVSILTRRSATEQGTGLNTLRLKGLSHEIVALGRTTL